MDVGGFPVDVRGGVNLRISMLSGPKSIDQTVESLSKTLLKPFVHTEKISRSGVLV